MLRMRSMLSWALFATFAAIGTSQGASAQERPCDTPEGRAFDFWIGEWDVTWPGGQGGTLEGQTGHGRNVVSRILDGCIIKEQFRSNGGFEGMSVSAFHRRTGKWHQTWVDSEGGYLSFTGTFHDGVMELRTEPFTNPDGLAQINRMLWKDIEDHSMNWHWQRSLDKGASWEDLWVIHYVRTRHASER